MLKRNHFHLPRMQKVMVLELLLSLLITGQSVLAQRFYPDDPLQKEPASMHVEEADLRRLNEYVDSFGSIFGKLGERQPENGIIPAQGVNTLGEVPDGPWYVNRQGRTRMSLEELVRGPGGWLVQKRKE